MRLTNQQEQALRLVDCGRRMRLTHLGNSLVSRQAKWLLAANLIREAPARWVAYELTSEGKAALADSLTRNPQ